MIGGLLARPWVALVLSSTCALAEGAGAFSGVFTSEPMGCQSLADEGKTPARRGDLVLLSGSGLLGYGYSCEFVNVFARPSARPGWVATAFCEESGLSYPDVISIADAGGGNVSLTFMSRAAGSSQSPPAAGNGGGEIGVGEMDAADAAALGEAGAEAALRGARSGASATGRRSPFASGGALARAPDDAAAGEIGPYELTAPGGGAGNVFYACPLISEGQLQ